METSADAVHLMSSIDKNLATAIVMIDCLAAYPIQHPSRWQLTPSPVVSFGICNVNNYVQNDSHLHGCFGLILNPRYNFAQNSTKVSATLSAFSFKKTTQIGCSIRFHVRTFWSLTFTVANSLPVDGIMTHITSSQWAPPCVLMKPRKFTIQAA